MDKFKLTMISAGFEHGGNVTHRHLDGHPDLLVYPFESQLGNRYYNDFLASIERVQYRYPEFSEGMTVNEIYEQIIDEELKTFLRKRNGSKFKDVNLVLNEEERINYFAEFLYNKPHSRRNIIEAFFTSTFKAWQNYYTKTTDNSIYVGYSPVIGIDANRMINDFSNVRIIHVVRNPFSAYRDTKRRPFPLPLNRYLITWNVYHSTVEMYARMHPDNVKVVRYEDLVGKKEAFMKDIASFIGIDYSETMLYPSWNGVEIKDTIAPWGTVLNSTVDYNRKIINDLTEEEIRYISAGTTALAKHFGYNEIDYISPLYDK